jgi:hypothetical protein
MIKRVELERRLIKEDIADIADLIKGWGLHLDVDDEKQSKLKNNIMSKYPELEIDSGDGYIVLFGSGDDLKPIIDFIKNELAY